MGFAAAFFARSFALPATFLTASLFEPVSFLGSSTFTFTFSTFWSTGFLPAAFAKGSLAADDLVGFLGSFAEDAFFKGSSAADFLVGVLTSGFFSTFAADLVFVESSAGFAALVEELEADLESPSDLARKGLSFPNLLILLRFNLSLTFLSRALSSLSLRLSILLCFASSFPCARFALAPAIPAPIPFAAALPRFNPALAPATVDLTAAFATLSSAVASPSSLVIVGVDFPLAATSFARDRLFLTPAFRLSAMLLIFSSFFFSDASLRFLRAITPAVPAAFFLSWADSLSFASLSADAFALLALASASFFCLRFRDPARISKSFALRSSLRFFA